MTWRGSTDTKDRIFAALVYLLPLYSAFAFGIFIFQQIISFTLIFGFCLRYLYLSANSFFRSGLSNSLISLSFSL